MAKETGGLKSGKLGDKVYVARHGQQVVRSYRSRKRQPGTPAQRAHWERIRVLSRLAADLKGVFTTGLEKAAQRGHCEPQDVFRRLNYPHVGPEGVDYASLALSEGNVEPVYFEPARMADGLTLHLAYDSALPTGAHGGDALYVAAYCPSLRSVAVAEPVERAAGEVVLALPPEWQGRAVHAYALLLNGRGLASATAYIPLPLSDSTPPPDKV